MVRGSKSMVTMMTLFVAFPLVLLLSGCPAGTFGSIVTPEQKASIIKGQTTKVDILKELGNPDQAIDLGDGKEQLSYISSAVKTSLIAASSTNTEFWVVLNKGVVEDLGERPTTKEPNYMK